MAFQQDSIRGYNSGSSWQLDCARFSIPILADSLISVEASTDSSSIKIVDYGCSEGYNSMILFKEALKVFRKESNRPISILHTDLPDNN